jgi:hypothetical protein
MKSSATRVSSHGDEIRDKFLRFVSLKRQGQRNALSLPSTLLLRRGTSLNQLSVVSSL